MFEVLVEVGDNEFITYDMRLTKEQAEAKAAELRRTKKYNTKIIDRDYKKPPKEDRYERHGRRDRDEDNFDY